MKAAILKFAHWLKTHIGRDPAISGVIVFSPTPVFKAKRMRKCIYMYNYVYIYMYMYNIVYRHVYRVPYFIG